MTTPTYIMAVPFDQQRVKNVLHIRRTTGAMVIWDEVRNVLDTFIRVLDAAGDEPAIILQDDVELAENWREQVEAVIQERGDAVIQFFSLRKSDFDKGSHYERGANYMSNLCFYLPAGHAADLKAFTEQWWEENPHHTGDDSCMAEWLKSRNEKYWHHVPSLVQHRTWKSVINESRSSKRQSPTFGVK